MIIIEILHYINEVSSSSYWRDGRNWWAVTDMVIVVVCLAAQRRKWKTGVWILQPETELPGLGYGCAIGNGYGE